jgi:hypothetical protein
MTYNETDISLLQLAVMTSWCILKHMTVCHTSLGFRFFIGEMLCVKNMGDKLLEQSQLYILTFFMQLKKSAADIYNI